MKRRRRLSPKRFIQNTSEAIKALISDIEKRRELLVEIDSVNRAGGELLPWMRAPRGTLPARARRHCGHG